MYINILLTGRRVGEILRMLAEKQAAFQDMALYNMHKIFLSEGEIEDVDFSTLLVRVTHRSETCWPVSSAMPGHQDSIANDRGVL
jgi:hypothetical protein